MIKLYEGPASDPYHTLIGIHYDVITLFTELLVQETIPAQFVNIPDAYGPDYTFPAMTEPEMCLGSEGFVNESDCDQAKVCYVVYEPGGAEVFRECESQPWVKEHKYEVATLVLFKGTEMEKTFVIYEGKECESCVPVWTGRWIITYQREGRGHWVTWCNLYVPIFVDNEKDARRWRWSEQYIADLCSLDCEPQTWQGNYLYVEKEMKLCDGSLVAGNHYDDSCPEFDFCSTQE